VVVASESLSQKLCQIKSNTAGISPSLLSSVVVRSESWNKMTLQRKKAMTMRTSIIVKRKKRVVSTFLSQTTLFMSSKR
jgi:trehalose-6-phosphate synthase